MFTKNILNQIKFETKFHNFIELNKTKHNIIFDQKILSDDISKEDLNKEKEIYMAQAQESGKPEEIIQKMVEGKIKKYVSEVTLIDQPFVKDSEVSVGKLLEQNDNQILSFYRLEVGEGVEKKDENFADEVMAQIKK